MISHSVSFELDRVIKDYENLFYMLPSGNLDEHRLRSCIRNIVRVIKSRRGNGHIPSCFFPQNFTPPVDHEYPYIYTLTNDSQARRNAHRIMMEDIRAREDDATRLQTRARNSKSGPSTRTGSGGGPR